MSARHTPGPWEVHHELIDGVETHIRAPIAGHPGDYWWIAGMCGGMLGDWDQANPHLIAAAPDLKDALRDLLRHYVQLVNSGDAGNWDPETEIVVKDARKALSQASGEAA